MKKPFSLIIPVVQLVFGLAAIAAFFLLRSSGGDMSRWVITLLLAIAFAALGLRGIIDHFKKD